MLLLSRLWVHGGFGVRGNLQVAGKSLVIWQGRQKQDGDAAPHIRHQQFSQDPTLFIDVSGTSSCLFCCIYCSLHKGCRTTTLVECVTEFRFVHSHYTAMHSVPVTQRGPGAWEHLENCDWCGGNHQTGTSFLLYVINAPVWPLSCKIPVDQNCFWTSIMLLMQIWREESKLIINMRFRQVQTGTAGTKIKIWNLDISLKSIFLLLNFSFSWEVLSFMS